MAPSNTDYDNPWKSIIELYFRDFISFFFPWIEPEIDWSREIKFLDKELQKIVRDAEIVKRYADKLIEVHRIDGETSLVLCHIEVQSQYEIDFSSRMYSYNYRLRDRYKLFCCQPSDSGRRGRKLETHKLSRFTLEMFG